MRENDVGGPRGAVAVVEVSEDVDVVNFKLQLMEDGLEGEAALWFHSCAMGPLLRTHAGAPFRNSGERG